MDAIAEIIELFTPTECANFTQFESENALGKPSASFSPHVHIRIVYILRGRNKVITIIPLSIHRPSSAAMSREYATMSADVMIVSLRSTFSFVMGILVPRYR